MPVPREYTQASADFERFMIAARDALGHATTHQTYYSVLAVFRVFRRRITVREGLRFADALPPVLRAIFVSDWDVEEALRPFGTMAEMTKEAQEFRREHSFTPEDVVEVIAQVLQDHVDRLAFERALKSLPLSAKAFWMKKGEMG